MRPRISFFLLILLTVLCVTDFAAAWGPATHIELGRTVLENLGLLPATLAALLARHATAYLYGNIAADIVFAKRLSRIKQFCHHWSTGFRVLENAQDDRQRAFAWGYLSHLAADTVAHGKYVPRQVTVSRCSVSFGHLYWELRADSMQQEASWDVLKQVRRCDHHDHHDCMADHIHGTFLPFELNVLMFNGINAVSSRPVFRRTIGSVNRLSRHVLSPTLLNNYQTESVDRILSILHEGKKSALLHEDPNGTSALMQIRVMKRGSFVLGARSHTVRNRSREAAAVLAPSVALTSARQSMGQGILCETN